ncbi:MAG: hypothetical protein IMY71_10855 [Bacteroidetes bacterium]|nr:hypothetical protein [Bacteroidota bacterium]
MKTPKNIFFILIISFLFLQLTVYSQEKTKKIPSDSIQITGEQKEKVSVDDNTGNILPDSTKSSIVVFSYAGDTIDKATIGEKLKVHFKKGIKADDQWVYANNIRIDELKPLKGESNWYWFRLKEVMEQNDTLSRILNPQNKPEISVRLSVGIDLEHRETIAGNFTIVFNNAKKTRKIFSGVTALILLIILGRILFKDRFKILRDHGTAMKSPPFSLARTQMAFWTIIILISYFVIWMGTGNMIVITGQVLALLGISAGTTLGAHLIDNDDITNSDIIKRHQEENNSKSFLLNILSDNQGLSIHRFQNVVFTIAIAGYFLYEVIHHYKIPELDTNLMILMGISSGTYLAIKKGENKAFQETPVG